VIAQDPDGWWFGERTDTGKSGKFPGSYVKISKMQQFKEEFESTSKKLEIERKRVRDLKIAKNNIKKEIQSIKNEMTAFNEEVRELKAKLLSIFKENRMETFNKVENLYALLKHISVTREKVQEECDSFLSEMGHLEEFMKSPPPEAKKDLKPKSVEKLEPAIQNLIGKMNTEQNQRENSNDYFEELKGDLKGLKQVLSKKRKRENNEKHRSLYSKRITGK